MIINQHLLLEAAPIKDMLTEKVKHKNGMSYGLSELGYDIRLKQRVVYYPLKYEINFDRGGYQVVPPAVLVNEKEQLQTNFTLASSVEEFHVPINLMGRVHDKSSLAREGLSVFNTIIEPGWNGFLTLELVFHGNKKLVLEAGTPIAQIIFEEIAVPVQYKGNYQNQEDKPIGSIFKGD